MSFLPELFFLFLFLFTFPYLLFTYHSIHTFFLSLPSFLSLSLPSFLFFSTLLSFSLFYPPFSLFYSPFFLSLALCARLFRGCGLVRVFTAALHSSAPPLPSSLSALVCMQSTQLLVCACEFATATLRNWNFKSFKFFPVFFSLPPIHSGLQSSLAI